jgi:hypothetical protein
MGLFTKYAVYIARLAILENRPVSTAIPAIRPDEAVSSSIWNNCGLVEFSRSSTGREDLDVHFVILSVERSFGVGW